MAIATRTLSATGSGKHQTGYSDSSGVPKTIEPVSHRRDAENERGGKRRPGDRQIKTNTKNGIRMTRNSVSNVGILNCIMTGNYLLSVRLPYVATETSMFQRPEDLSARPCGNTRHFCNFSTLALRKPCKPPIYFNNICRRFGPTPSMVSRELVFLTFAVFYGARQSRDRVIHREYAG